MATREIDAEYVNKVIDVMFDSPTAQQMSFLIEAYAKIGYYAAAAESMADEAETALKLEEADSFVETKESDPKASVEMVKSKVMLATTGARDRYNYRKRDARKLKVLHESIEQAINAIKFLDRNAGAVRIG